MDALIHEADKQIAEWQAKVTEAKAELDRWTKIRALLPGSGAKPVVAKVGVNPNRSAAQKARFAAKKDLAVAS